MMKNFCLHLVSQYKMSPNKIKIMGIIISGLNIKALGMSFNNGSISLKSISDRLHMPETVCEIPRLLPPVLNRIYNLNEVRQLLIRKESQKKTINIFPLASIYFIITITYAIVTYITSTYYYRLL
ncbi:hypothetical protein BDF21DRAFT_429596 [Thamnidium elegans]|nr:hypothetical protein BDF21DRAFT_429596 [Thamnidium elegans]